MTGSGHVLKTKIGKRAPQKYPLCSRCREGLLVTLCFTQAAPALSGMEGYEAHFSVFRLLASVGCRQKASHSIS